ncbi:MFS transporter [Planotetraspora phitsanulokensis]|uniref:MFS transporter n=1 Tax=Planotetraspora phitsanulokensis TaxID=575192 RepID=A0A8J3U4A7_9ACTN|nr:MFS transporter [Planotetraspora phitsanulokensis]GII38348.1 MFS transporter [Planotetraspora phitsanulokensis]
MSETPVSEPPITSPGAERSRPGRNEVVLVAFTAMTNLADGVLKITLPLLAVGLGGSAGQVAGVGLTLTLPWLLVSLPVGVLADRADRRRLIIVADLVRLAAALALLAAASSGGLSLAVLYAAGLVIGVAEVVANTATGAVVPAAVPRRRRARANAWIAGTETLANEFCGPAVGGLLVGVGASLALGSSAAAFAAGAVLIALLAGSFRPARRNAAEPASQTGSVPTTRRGTAGMLAEIGEGLRFLWRDRLLRTLSLTITVLAGAWSAWLALMPSYATAVLETDPRGYGLLISAIGLGGLAGAGTTAVVNRLLGVRWALFADLVGTFLMVVVPAILPVAWAVGVAAFAGGMGGTLWSVNSRTIAQALVPDRLLGRYGSAARLLGWGTLPLGAALAGVLAEVFGLRFAFGVFAVVVAALTVPFLRVVTPAELRRATESDTGEDSDADHENIRQNGNRI